MRQNYYREYCLALSGMLFGTVGNVVWHYRECCLALSGILLSVCPNGWDYLSQWVGQMLSILFCAYFYRPFHSLSLPHHFLLTPLYPHGSPPFGLLFIHISTNGSATEARRAEKITGRGEAPAKAGGNISPEGATECSATPSGFVYTPPIYRGFTPVCGLNAPSGLPIRDVYKE
jgi:hypothetical protein